MTVELRPLGVACNLACTYCYQEPMRKAGNINRKYDIDKMLDEAIKTGQMFHLFGGEALLVPKKDLERIWKRGYEIHGKNGIQTNGTLIDDDHIKLFKKYNVYVGVSIDGPNELNSLREVRTNNRRNIEEKTKESTDKIIENIRRLVAHGIGTSVIITLHRMNATKEKLPRLMNFIRWLGDIGVKSGNIHVLEVDETMKDQEIHVLSQEENIYAFKKLAEFFEENEDLSFNPFNDYKKAMLLEEFDSLTCYFNRCDPLNTQAVYGIEGDGALSNCGRTNKEGIDWYKTDDMYYERYISLYNTPLEYNGCQGCRFFLLCSGGCPGESVDNDFRNKTANCATMKAMLEFYEQKAIEQGKTPWSMSPIRKELERQLFQNMVNGNAVNIRHLKENSNTMRVVPVK